LNQTTTEATLTTSTASNIRLVILLKIDNQLQLETWHSKRLIVQVKQSIQITCNEPLSYKQQ
jgi:hypothetical protein